MRKITTIVVLLLMVTLSSCAQQAKYVFYFIGDGMGVNHVNATETYLGALEGRIGITELCFANFPYTGLVNTQSASSGVTDSAAAGTALATGVKTKNGTLGMAADLETPVTGIAQWAHDAGAAVGVTTTVTVDHATPGAFYAHVKNRGQGWDIEQDLLRSGFDFFAASDCSTPDNPVEGGKDFYALLKDNGYTMVRGYKAYQKAAKKADKMVLFQPGLGSMEDRGSVPYAIDRTKDDLTLSDITRAAINFLTKKQSEKDGFFLMVEGGKIDYSCHANDAATMIHEVIDMDEAVKVAYEFYQQHPDETLIVVTADHETGGLSLGNGLYELRLENLRYETMSIAKLGKELHKLHDKLGDKYNLEAVKNFLKENFGFWGPVQLNEEQEKCLETAFNNIMEGKGKDNESLYQKDDELATAVRLIVQDQSLLHWGHGSHSGGYVPTFAIGVGAENFSGRMDNTDVPKRMARIAGWLAE